MTRKYFRVGIALTLLSIVTSQVPITSAGAKTTGPSPQAFITAPVPGQDIFKEFYDVSQPARWSKATGYGFNPCTSINVGDCREIDGSQLSRLYEADGPKLKRYMDVGGKDIATRSVLGICQTATSLNCIARLTVSNGSGTTVATYATDFIKGSPFTGDAARGIPDGRYAPVFTAASHPHATGNQYVVAVATVGHHQLVNCTSSKNARSRYCVEKANVIRVPLDDHSADIINCAKQKSSYCAEKSKYPLWTPGHREVRIDVLALSPLALGGVTDELPPDYSFEVTFRLAKEATFNGWLAGRINSPTFRQSSITGGVEYVLSGKVSEVIGMKDQTTCANLLTMPQTQIDAINSVRKKWAFWNDTRRQSEYVSANPGSTYSDVVSVSGCSPGITRNTQNVLTSYPYLSTPTSPHSTSQWSCDSMLPAGNLTLGFDTDIKECNGVASFSEIATAQGDKSTHVSNQWNVANRFHKEGLSEDFKLARCAADNVVGVVGSNATLYDELPYVDGQSGQLVYSVAAPHWSLDGVTPSSGKYSLTVSKEYAKCQWGIDPASTEIKVSVYDGKTKQTSTQVVVAASEGNQFLVNVSGFHYSSPKVRVSMSDKKKSKTRVVRVRPSKSLNITRVSAQSATMVSTWYLTSGKCKMSSKDNSIKMAKSGTCTVMLSRYNVKKKNVIRTKLELRP